MATEKNTLQPTRESDLLEGLNDIQSLVVGATELAETGEPAWRLLTMAQDQISALCTQLQQASHV